MTVDAPIAQLEAKLPELTAAAEHSEIWSVPLDAPSPQRTLVLRKFLAANKGVVTDTEDALLATLKWRKEFDPVSAATTETHDESKFGGLGFVTQLDADAVPSKEVIRPGGGGRKVVVTWNVYGAVKDHQKTFGDQDEFLRWRVGLMERGVQALRLMDAEIAAPDDDIAIVQVHDYLNVSFLRPAPATRAVTKKTIEVLAAHYPELLSRKYFLNVPWVMGFMYNAIKPFVAKETAAKFQVMSYGNGLASELGKEIPKTYGGEAKELE